MAPRTAVLYLDVDDEITSAAARIRASEATRVAMVVPPGSRIATSRINFRLLAREALERNRRLSIVAPDAASRALAASAGLPVFLSVGEFESAEAELGLAGLAGGAKRAASTAAPRVDDGVSDGTTIEAPADDTILPGAGGSELAEISTEDAVLAGAPDAAGAVGAAGMATLAGELAAGPSVVRPRSGGSLPIVRPRLRLDTDRLILGGVILVLALLVIAVAGYLVLPSATIVIHPKVESIGPFTLSVRADPAATAVDRVNNVIPAQRVDLPLSVSDTFPATGVRVVTTKAAGSVTFQNCDTGRNHSIPAGSIVSTQSGIGFATQQDVRLDRAQLVGIPPFQSVQCSTGGTPVTAAKGGPAGNVDAGAIDQMPSGYDTTVLHVANSDPTSGGTRREIPRVVQKDVDAAVAGLAKRIQDQFSTAAADPSNAPEGATLFPRAAQLSTPKPTSDPKALVGKEVASFQLTLTATGTVLAVDEAPLQQLAVEKLRSNVATDHDLVADSLTVTPGNPTATVAGVTFPLTVSAKEVARLNADDVRNDVKGKSIAEARSTLEDYGQSDISVWPDWVSSIPTIDARLSVRIESSVAVESPAPSASPSRPAASSGSQPASSPAASVAGSSPAPSASASGSSGP
jgi:hypothetical protein